MFGFQLFVIHLVSDTKKDFLSASNPFTRSPFRESPTEFPNTTYPNFGQVEELIFSNFLANRRSLIDLAPRPSARRHKSQRAREDGRHMMVCGGLKDGVMSIRQAAKWCLLVGFGELLKLLEITPPNPVEVCLQFFCDLSEEQFLFWTQL